MKRFVNILHAVFSFNLPIPQHVPPYPSGQEQPLVVGVPEFWQLSLLHERISDKCGHDPPQVGVTVTVLPLVRVPLVPHKWVQGLHVDQELTWQERGLQLLLLRRLQDSASGINTVITNAKTKNWIVHIQFFGKKNGINFSFLYASSNNVSATND